MREEWSTGGVLGVAGGAAGLAASLFVLFGPVVTVTRTGSDGTVTRSTRSGIDYLLGHPDVQVELFAWPVLLGTASIVGAIAAWSGPRAWTGAAAAALAIFSVVGMFSIGLLYAPAALSMIVAALALE